MILTLLPLLIFPALIIFSIVMFGTAEAMEDSGDDSLLFFPTIGVFVGFMILIGLLSTIVWIYYLVHAIRNEQLEQTELIIWILLFIFVGFIPHIVYFFMKIWPDEQQKIEV